MTQNPHEIALAKIAEIEQRMQARAAEQDADAGRLTEWHIAARLFGEEFMGPMPVKKVTIEPAANYREGSNKASIVKALTHGEIWQDATEIQQMASVFKGATIPMASLSPALTGMKDDGVIVRDGLKVALKARVGSAPRHYGGGLLASAGLLPREESFGEKLGRVVEALGSTTDVVR